MNTETPCPASLAAAHGSGAVDPVNHPPHYTQHPSGVECIQVTECMNFCLGNAVKYIWRADLKSDAIEDLEKARWYVSRELERRKRQNVEVMDAPFSTPDFTLDVPGAFYAPNGRRLSESLRLQVEMAAKGCVSGTLREWPMLARALKELGHGLPPSTPAATLRAICKGESSPADKFRDAAL